MCQLLGMNCNIPTDICFSFTGFQARGGRTDIHQDGWGIAFFEGKGVRQFLDSQASIHSPIAELVRNYPIRSKNVISHIRRATQGRIMLENTHPFMRELWGQYWIFAHNGNLPDFSPKLSGAFRPVGNTDSEMAFCYLLQTLNEKFGDRYPGTGKIFEEIRKITRDLGKKGEFNFLLSNGEALIAHCSTHLAYLIRRAPFTTAKLVDEEMSVNFSDVTSANDRVAIIATVPLTQNEEWITLEAGTILLFQDGEVIKKEKTVPEPKHVCDWGCKNAIEE